MVDDETASESGTPMSVPLFEIRCTNGDPDKCVLYLTRGKYGQDDPGEDPWFWLHTCHMCKHSLFIVTPYLHTRRQFGPGCRLSGKNCKKLSEFTVDIPDSKTADLPDTSELDKQMKKILKEAESLA